jgi:hypothetical protein
MSDVFDAVSDPSGEAILHEPFAFWISVASGDEKP